MWRNYLLVAVRALAKNRAYAAINIVGLALGLAACVLILLYVRYETSYDDWMQGRDRAYQLQTYYRATDTGGEEMQLQMSAIVAGRTLKKDYPDQVERVVYVRSFAPVVIQDGRAGLIRRLRMADANLFEVLNVPFVRGSAASALPDSHSIALSESEARKRFGDADPMGRTLTIVDNQGNVDYRVTGVFKDWPRNSSFSADAVARFDLDEQFSDRTQGLTDWDNQQGWNFVRLRSTVDAELIASRMAAWEKRNIPDQMSGNQRVNPGDAMDFRLVALRDVHLGEAQDTPLTPGNDRFTVVTFAVIALLILGMACVNFTNLATARASQRAREVALRKVLGASRRQLILQFLSEAVMVTGIAMVIALALVELALPAFNGFLDAGITTNYLGADGVLLPAVALTLVVGVLAGLYPAFYLARFEPAKILKANKSAADAQGSGRLRNVLVVTQFAVSIGLIICTTVIYAQTVYARTADAGFRRDGLLQVGNLGFRGVENRDGAVTEQIRRLPGVVAAARTQIAANPGGNSMTRVYLPGEPRPVELGDYSIEQGFFEAMGMKLLAGRALSEAQGRDLIPSTFGLSEADTAAQLRTYARRGLNVVVTEAAAQRMGFRTPEAAVGRQLQVGMLPSEYGLLPATIVGVVRDARFRSIRDPLQPIVYSLRRDNFNVIAVRFDGDPASVREQVEAVWNRNIPQVPFRGDFADEIVRDQYDRDEARGRLFAGFAVLAVVIGCLGLFGLAAFTAERRTKEIGIRKVLGARTRDIVRLLVWQFSQPVLLANIVAWPVAWWLMRGWLNGFDQRIALTPLPFVAAGSLALAIAVATVAGHSYRIARAKPIAALRYE